MDRVVSLPLAIAVIELSARLGLVTDQGIATVVRRNFIKPVVYPVLALVVVANTFNIGADLGAMAASYGCSYRYRSSPVSLCSPWA